MGKNSRDQKKSHKSYNNKMINEKKKEKKKKQRKNKLFYLGILFVIIAVISIIYFAVLYHAKGYYINNMNVQVDINNKKQYKVTEIIDVHYYSQKHGINRVFGGSLSNYKYEIDDVNVDGAPFKRQYDSQNTIRIGDPNKSVTGDKRYVISYTINHSDSGLDKNRILDLDILGNQWDTKVKNYSAKINYPSDSGISKIKVCFDKRTGDKTYIYIEDKSLLKYEEKDNSLLIDSVKSIPANKGIKVKAVFGDDLFKSIPTSLPYKTKHYYNSTDDEKECSPFDIFLCEFKDKIKMCIPLMLFLFFVSISYLGIVFGKDNGNHQGRYYDEGPSGGDFGGGSSDSGGSGGGSSW